MFDILLFPVSAVFWFWHWSVGALTDPDGGLAWVVAIVLLVCTVRALLVGLALRQVRAARVARLLAPRIRRLRESHRDDRARLAAEIQKLHASTGTGPLAGCLPALVQIPVFLSLYWVLRGFAPGAESNQVFDQNGIWSFLHADVLGARLGVWLGQSAGDLAAAGTGHAQLALVAVPVAVLAGLATFLSIRLGLRRQDPADADPRLAAVTRAMMYLAPVGLVASAWLFPVPLGVLVYLAASNVWTLVQQQVLHTVVDREPAPRLKP
ncbi:preprotein translocase YidC [Actinophytocola xinjiangensis]|uniref:Membrane protein insertase YidC n=1 Tax=Actinophytocola xinjiangensis TaxID=485602 RepID=A0A7Z0WE22_9PSEU|nr:membrane protein insertase YidC [Actinophytocola xinjiangensis]OLF05186.1 preprotein translocase YidC [Actinophytocola xinjiangensis]